MSERKRLLAIVLVSVGLIATLLMTLIQIDFWKGTNQALHNKYLGPPETEYVERLAAVRAMSEFRDRVWEVGYWYFGFSVLTLIGFVILHRELMMARLLVRDTNDKDASEP